MAMKKFHIYFPFPLSSLVSWPWCMGGVWCGGGRWSYLLREWTLAALLMCCLTWFCSGPADDEFKMIPQAFVLNGSPTVSLFRGYFSSRVKWDVDNREQNEICNIVQTVSWFHSRWQVRNLLHPLMPCPSLPNFNMAGLGKYYPLFNKSAHKTSWKNSDSLRLFSIR